MSDTRRSLISLLSLLSLLGAVSSGAQSKKTEAPIITFNTVKIDYCDNDAELATAKVHVKTVITNHGTQNLILSREFGPVERVRIRNTADRAVFAPDYHLYGTDDVQLGDVPDSKLFETLNVGGSAERDFIVAILVSKNPALKVAGSVKPGSYQIWAMRSTWPFYADEDRADRMSRLWRGLGVLVTTSVKLRGLRVEISLPLELHPCSEQMGGRTAPP